MLMGKDIFAHFTDIQTQGFKVLLGQRVEFTVVQGKKAHKLQIL